MVCAVAGSTAPVRYCTVCPGHAARLSSLLAACSNAATTTLSPFHYLVMASGVALVAFRRRFAGLQVVPLSGVGNGCVDTSCHAARARAC
jgi:hypothetical protein